MVYYWNIVRYEYQMSIKRWGLWLGFIILFMPYFIPSLMPGDKFGQLAQASLPELWKIAARLTYQMNVLLPLLAGIMLADRLVRDWNLKVIEILKSTALKRRIYILAKYSGALLSILTPVLVGVFFYALILILQGASLMVLPILLCTFLTMIVPAYAFVTAFTLACPLIIPVRIYQILFTGYWFWGNFVWENKFPTLNGTYLTPSGLFAMVGLYNTQISDVPRYYSTGDVFLNWLVLAGSIFAVWVCLDYYLAWRHQQA